MLSLNEWFLLSLPVFPEVARCSASTWLQTACSGVERGQPPAFLFTVLPCVQNAGSMEPGNVAELLSQVFYTDML